MRHGRGSHGIWTELSAGRGHASRSGLSFHGQCHRSLVHGRGDGVAHRAVLIFAVVPFTLFVIMSTNKKLLDPAVDRSSDTVHRLLKRWGRLHAVRSVLALAASVVFLASL